MSQQSHELSITLQALRESGYFDAEWYVQAYPDVPQTGLDPLEHYARYGGLLGRKPSPNFDMSGWRGVGAGLFDNPILHKLRQPLSKKGTPSYQEWIERNDTLTSQTLHSMRREVYNLSYQPKISIILPTYNPDEHWFSQAIQSVRDQVYENWELCIADDASTKPHSREIIELFCKLDSRIRRVFRPLNGHISASSNSALSLATGDFVTFLDHDDELRPHALLTVVEQLNANRELDIIYSDEDKIDANGQRHSPHFKPDFNYELLLGQNYICHLMVIRRSLVEAIGGFRHGVEGAQDHDLVLRAVVRSAPSKIAHISKILYHWRSIAGSTALSGDAKPYAARAQEKTVRDHFRERGVAATIRRAAPFNLLRIDYHLPPAPPKVDIIIPTKNQSGLVRQLVEGLLQQTSYPNFHIHVVNHESDEKNLLNFFEELKQEPRFSVINYEGSFNYSAINNYAAGKTSGDLICLLNNDIKIIHHDWLTVMVGHCLQKGVGAVGAKLLYDDDTIQHGGVILGVQGVAGHSHKHLHKSHPGYAGRMHQAQDLSACTAACLLLRRTAFTEVNGLDEQLAVAFNDVDLCLRIGKAGYRIVWTPHACLYHLESHSRGYEDTPEKQARFIQEVEFIKTRWGNHLKRDPHYNSNLTLDANNFALNFHN